MDLISFRDEILKLDQAEITGIVRALFSLEEEFKTKRRELRILKNNLYLNTNWDEENFVRKEAGLPPIKNETQRKAFIEEKVAGRDKEVLEAELKYHAIYEYIQLRKVEH